MGYPNIAVDNFRFDFNYFAKPLFLFNFRLGYERLGEQNINGAFLGTKQNSQ